MTRRLTTEEFIAKAIDRHGGRYDYSLVEYTTAARAVSIICREHGQFVQTPNAHLCGKGCSVCGGSNPLTSEEFIARSKIKHGDIYNYSLVEYTTNWAPVDVVCRVHGKFSQVASDHMAGKGCRKCKGLEPYTADSFISRATSTHGGTYSYDLVSEVGNSKSKVLITCKRHGPFDQSIEKHIAGQGCPKCSKTGYSRDKPGVLYIYRLSNETLTYTGFGVSNKFKDRHATHKRNMRAHGFVFELVYVFEFQDGGYAEDVERAIISKFPLMVSTVPGFKLEATHGGYLEAVARFVADFIANKTPP